MRRLAVTALLAALSVAACSKPTDLASNANGKGRESVPAAATGTPPPEIPADELAAINAEPDAAAPASPDIAAGYTAKTTPDTVLDYRASVAGDINALPPVSDAAVLATAFADWRARAAASPGAQEQGAVQLGADPQEYRPSDAELVAAEAGDRLSAALQGADDTTKAAVAAALGDAPEARIYRRFDYRHSDVMGSGRYFYASKPKEAALPL
ncbi:MAG: hypothetical protein ABL956_03595 [Hyphomonadaceae bacterium]